MTDNEVLEKALAEDRILITNDKDFGEIGFRCRKSHGGIVLLRLEQERVPYKIETLQRLLGSYAAQLSDGFAFSPKHRFVSLRHGGKISCDKLRKQRSSRLTSKRCYAP